MRIGLIDIEPKIYNTAYMQLAGYHKKRGDSVEWWSPLTHRQFDHVYCSSIFSYTKKHTVPKRTICGGTGFDITSRLSQEIEAADLDYSIYPDCQTSYIWFSRGCIRDCPFCIVRQKEGKIRPVEPKNLNPNGRYITIMDNNFFASEKWPSAIAWLRYRKQQVDIQQGIDARLLTAKMCKALLTLRHYKQIHIAWDNPKEDLEPKLREITKIIRPWRLMCYVLIGFWSTEEEDLHRIDTLRSLGIDPFVMPFDRRELYQRAFARWVNHKGIFKSMPWPDYKRRVAKQELAGTGWGKPTRVTGHIARGTGHD